MGHCLGSSVRTLAPYYLTIYLLFISRLKASFAVLRMDVESLDKCLITQIYNSVLILEDIETDIKKK